MANPPIWTRALTDGTVIPNYEAAGKMSNVWGNGAQAQAAASVFTQDLSTTGFSSAAEWTGFAGALSDNGADTASLFSLAPNSFNVDGITGAGNTDGVPQSSPAWTFITAPQNISWSLNNAANRIDMFGTNNPPVVSGTKGMAELTLGDSLAEGFTRGQHVQAKMAALESLLDYSLNRELGFVDVPVYQVNANSKRYGGADSYYIIKDVKIEEQLRDLSGNITRGKVSITLMQVPAFQVSNGRDLASKAEAGAKSPVETQLKQASDIDAKSGPSVPASEKTGAGKKGTADKEVIKSTKIAKGTFAGDYRDVLKDTKTGKLTSTVTQNQLTPGSLYPPDNDPKLNGWAPTVKLPGVVYAQ